MSTTLTVLLHPHSGFETPLEYIDVVEWKIDQEAKVLVLLQEGTKVVLSMNYVIGVVQKTVEIDEGDDND